MAATLAFCDADCLPTPGWLAAGLPETVPSTTVDRQCGSSLQAIHFAVQGVLAGSYDLVVASPDTPLTKVMNKHVLRADDAIACPPRTH